MLICDTTAPPVPSASNGASSNSSPSGLAIRATTYTIPDGDVVYEIVANVKKTNQPKKVVCTADDMYFVFIEEKKSSEILSLYDPMTGDFIHTVKLNYPAYKDISLMVPIPKQPHLVGLIDSEKGIVMNVRDKKVGNDISACAAI